MPCVKPYRAYAPAIGGRVRIWKKSDPEYWVEPYTGLTLPCGYCELCRTEQARQTAVRIIHEATLWAQNSFITATYDENSLPQHGSLNYSHLQKFWKRLRKHIGELRYYAVGEYGDKTLRPHYHAIIFGHAFIHDRIITDTTPHMMWVSPTLNAIWGMGTVKIGAVSFETARYTASYVLKKLRAKQKYVRVDPETGELIPIVQPRAFMSRNLAKGWWDQWNRGVTDHDHVIVNGQPQKPPRAYDKWLKATNETKLTEIKNRRKEKAEPTTPEQMRARAENARARIALKSKKV